MTTILRKLRILDSDNCISITNLLVYITIITGFINGVDLYWSLGVITLYGFGRWLNFKRGQVIDAAMRKLLENQAIMQQQLNEQKDKITSLSVKAGIQGPVVNLDTKLRRF